MSKTKPHSDTMGAVFGAVTFVLGIALLLLTFKLAYDMFTIKPEVAVSAQKGSGIDVARASQSLAEVFLRFVLLLIMAIVGSTIANRGIKLYVSARAIAPLAPEPHPTEKGESHVKSA